MSERIREVLRDAIRQHVEQNELKPCPFCGNQPNYFKVRDDRYVEGEQNWVVECKDMGCIFGRSSPDRSIDNLIANWNKRADFWWIDTA